MSLIQWGKTADLWYEAGIDRGVLFTHVDDPPVVRGFPWDGLTGFVDQTEDTAFSVSYIDGRKIVAQAASMSDFNASLSAFTYPDEFEPHQGVGEYGDSLRLHHQKVTPFGLTFRTQIFGGGSQPIGYRIHILFNVTARPEAIDRETKSQGINLSDLRWSLSSVPEELILDYRKTSYLILDSREIDAELLGIFEEMLYGTEVQDATLLSLENFVTIATALATITITDNGDGTWTATGDDRYITMLDGTTFQIQDVDGTYLDTNTYEVSTTFHFDL